MRHLLAFFADVFRPGRAWDRHVTTALVHVDDPRAAVADLTETQLARLDGWVFADTPTYERLRAERDLAELDAVESVADAERLWGAR